MFKSEIQNGEKYQGQILLSQKNNIFFMVIVLILVIIGFVIKHQEIRAIQKEKEFMTGNHP